MPEQSFISQSHFQLYDKIIPIFRLVCIICLIAVVYWKDGGVITFSKFGILIAYFCYSLLLICFKHSREIIVLRYPIVIGIFEILLATYGIVYTGGSSSPFYFAYILVIAFYGIANTLKYSLVVSTFCAVSYVIALWLYHARISTFVIVEVVFLFVIAFFIGTVSGKISNFNINLALYDPLTALYNRNFFSGELDILLQHKDKKRQSFCLMVIDVDDFKEINDQKGHLEGDRILYEIGRLLHRSIRKEDIAARYGGDEFVLLLMDTNERSAAAFSKRLERSLKNELSDEVSISIGYAVFPHDGEHAEDLFYYADMAMYETKMLRKARQAKYI